MSTPLSLAEPSDASLQSPYPYFGGKSAVAADVWQRFGDVSHFIDPFFGSAAMLLGAPWPHKRLETINDRDGFVANFWRAVQAAAEEVALYADWPVNELDLHARRKWLIAQNESLAPRLVEDPEFFDARIAGWWVWGLSQWIGSDFLGSSFGKRPHLAGTGTGVCRATYGPKPSIGHCGNGIHRLTPGKKPDIRAKGIHCPTRGSIHDEFMRLQQRLRRVRVCCGDWTRVVTPAVLYAPNRAAPPAVFLDPPYAAERATVYDHDDAGIAIAVAKWARAAVKNDPVIRIALCDYNGTHDMPGWSEFRWSTRGGYANQGKGNTQAKRNRHLETIWFSPGCQSTRQADLFA
jgi:DNA adenine methylase